VEGGGERVGEFGAIALEGADEAWKCRVLVCELDDEFGEGFITDTDVIF
jgi:hypothetical protein